MLAKADFAIILLNVMRVVTFPLNPYFLKMQFLLLLDIIKDALPDHLPLIV